MSDYISFINDAFHEYNRTFNTAELKKLLSTYLYKDIHINNSTLTWRIHDLKEKGFIQHAGRGMYTLPDKKAYRPEITNTVINIFHSIKYEFPYIDLCIEDTRWYNEFMVHQTFKNAIVAEVEKDAVDAVFNSLTKTLKDVFKNPDSFIFETYISKAENPVIVKSLISESPVQEQNDIKVASLEKMLVDLLSDDELYSAQSTEIPNIFKNTMDKYVINISKLKRYARRRNRLDKIETLITTLQ